MPFTETQRLSIVRLESPIYVGEWDSIDPFLDETLKTFLPLPPLATAQKYIKFLLKRHKFLELIYNNNINGALDCYSNELSTMFKTKIKPIEQTPLNLTDKVNPEFFRTLEEKLLRKNGTRYQIRTSAEIGYSEFGEKICSYQKPSGIFSSASIPRSGEIGTINPFSAFEERFKISIVTKTTAGYFEADFFLDRAIGEEIENLSLLFTMAHRSGEEKGMFKRRFLGDATRTLPKNREELRKKVREILFVLAENQFERDENLESNGFNKIDKVERTENETNKILWRRFLRAKNLWQTENGTSQLWSLSFSNKKDSLCVASKNGEVWIYGFQKDFRKNKKINAVKRKKTENVSLYEYEPQIINSTKSLPCILSVEFSPDDNYVLLCSLSGVHVWDLGVGLAERNLDFDFNKIQTRSRTKNAKLNVRDEGVTFKEKGVRSAKWFPDSRHFVFVCRTGLCIGDVSGESFRFLEVKNAVDVALDIDESFSEKTEFTAFSRNGGKTDPCFWMKPCRRIITCNERGVFFVSFPPFACFSQFADFQAEVPFFRMAPGGRNLFVHVWGEVQQWDIAAVTPELIAATYCFDKHLTERRLFYPSHLLEEEGVKRGERVRLDKPSKLNGEEKASKVSNQNGFFKEFREKVPFLPDFASASDVSFKALWKEVLGNYNFEKNSRKGGILIECPKNSGVSSNIARRVATLLPFFPQWESFLDEKTAAILNGFYSPKNTKSASKSKGNKRSRAEFHENRSGIEREKETLKFGGVTLKLLKLGGNLSRGNTECSPAMKLVRRFSGFKQKRLVLKSCIAQQNEKGLTLFCGSEDGNAYCWGRFETPELILRGHTAAVNSVDCFVAENGDVLAATAGDDCCVRFWVVC